MLCCFMQARKATSKDRKAAKQLAVQQLLSEQKVAVGGLLDGVVTIVHDYGAFVDVGNGVNALLHKSQITAEGLTSVAQVIAVREKGPGMQSMHAYYST
jgi:ribosomal protein S1